MLQKGLKLAAAQREKARPLAFSARGFAQSFNF